MNTLIDKITATNEVNAWLDYKRIKASVRENHKDGIKVLVDGIMDGTLTIAPEDYMYGKEKLTGPVIRQTLSFPIGALTEITYKPRETTGNLSASMRSNEGSPISACYGSMLSNGIFATQLDTLDSEDSRVLQAIVSFFL